MTGRAFDVIALAIGLGVLMAMAKAKASAPPPVPRMPSAAELFANDLVTGTL